MIGIAGEKTILLSIMKSGGFHDFSGLMLRDIAELPNAEVVVLYEKIADLSNLPTAIIIRKESLGEFFSWVSTYLTPWTPLTSVVPVYTREQYREYRFKESGESFGSTMIWRGLASLIIGEVLCEWRLAGDKSYPSYRSLRSCFGYVAAQGIRDGVNDIEELKERWVRALTAVGADERRVNLQVLVKIWQTISDCIGSSITKNHHDSESSLLLKKILHGDHGFTLNSSNLARHTGQLASRSALTKEQLVMFFSDRIRSAQRKRSFSESIIDASIGASFSSGALSHFDVLYEMTDGNLEVLLWYSFISGFEGGIPASTTIERNIFRLTKTTDPKQHSSTGDISLEELEVAFSKDAGAIYELSSSFGYVDVRLMPRIAAYLRVRSKEQRQKEPDRTILPKDRSQEELERLIDELRYLFTKGNSYNFEKRKNK